MALVNSQTSRRTMTFTAAVLTLYPEMFPGPLGISLAGRALGEGVWALDTVHIRDFAVDKHRTVDDTPAGGGAGMVLRADIVAAAVDHAVSRYEAHPVLAMTPRGAPLTQQRVRELAFGPGVTILCGRFEGFDERLFEARPFIEQVSLGDIVLSGGEPAAIALLDACIRLLPGVMGAPSSGAEESFEDGLLEYPHYTRPQEWEGRTIPEVLRSGDHAKIAAWRKRQAETDTRLRRPDLWERHTGARVQSASGARREKKDQVE
jgi:tRNA (guanine37-N1)-methyltransferase